MSNDQKIMDKFFEQTQEILVLKASNRVLNSEIQSLKAENLRLLDESMVQEALKETAEKNLSHCSFVGDRLLEMQNAAIDLAQKVTELESKLKIAVEALKDAHYNACSCCNSSDEVEEHCQKAIKEIDGSIEKE